MRTKIKGLRKKSLRGGKNCWFLVGFLRNSLLTEKLKHAHATGWVLHGQQPGSRTQELPQESTEVVVSVNSGK